MRRLTVAAIIAVMAAGVFTGCGGTAQQGSGNGTAPAAQTDAGNAAGQTDTAGNAEQQAAEQTDNASGGSDTQSRNTGSQDIGEDAALQKALEAAGISEADASRIRVSLDRDDGQVLYEVKFDAGQTEYEYEILASDGKVISSDVEQRRDDDDRDDDRRRSADVAVSSEKAIETALAKVPGATQKDIRIELDYDDGRYQYEGDIIYDRIEYDFEIDADSGKIISWSEERD